MTCPRHQSNAYAEATCYWCGQHECDVDKRWTRLERWVTLQGIDQHWECMKQYVRVSILGEYAI